MMKIHEGQEYAPTLEPAVPIRLADRNHALSSLVYCYRCRCALTYVGKSVQNLFERIKQHILPKLLLPDADLRRNSADSAITCHLKVNSACLDKLRKDAAAERFSVLCQARSRSALDVLEALFIHRLAPELCSQKEHVRALTLC